MKTPRILFLIALLLAGKAVATETADIAVTIKPLHSLVQGVMGDTDKAGLLIKDYVSPHNFSLQPSHIKLLREADAVFYIDDTFEVFLRNALAALPERTRRYAVTQSTGLTRLSIREGGVWEAHKHESHEHHSDKHEHNEHNEHNDDMHIWLDPNNAKKIVEFIAQKLGAAYPENRNAYQANARTLIRRIEQLDARLAELLLPVKDKPFIVFHDAYQYFERHYSLTGAGAITLEPDRFPSANRIREIRERIKHLGSACVFREPQFSDKLINTVIKGSQAKRATLDPLGADLSEGSDLYFELLENLARSFSQCLSR